MHTKIRIDPGALRDELALRDSADPRSPEFMRFVIRLSEAMNVDIPSAHHEQLATLAGCVEYLGARSDQLSSFGSTK